MGTQEEKLAGKEPHRDNTLLCGNIKKMAELIQKDKQAKETQMLSLKEALDQINAVYSASCSEKGLEYRFTGSPEAEEAYTGDAFQLERALMNILDNAVKFTDAPGTVRFMVEAGSPGEECKVLRVPLGLVRRIAAERA